MADEKPQQQRRKGSNRGGVQRQDGGGYQPKPKDPRLADPDWIKGATGALGMLIEKNRVRIEPLLPITYSFDKFRIIVDVAVRKNAEILLCTQKSIITACLSAAYDGLMPDGREGAMVPSNNKQPDGVTWALEARWNPMVAGLRKQILAGGQVSDVVTTIIYSNEVRQGRFIEKRGTEMSIVHDPLPDTQRGEAAGAYAVAFFKDGRKPTFETMWKADIEHVLAQAKGGNVWKTYPLEMWRKTVLRRFRKSLPGGNDVTDMEARELFPDYAGDQELAALPKPRAPQRKDFEKLEDKVGQDSTPLDLGDDVGRFRNAREEQLVRADQGEDRDQGEQQQQRREAEQPREESHDPDTGEVKPAADKAKLDPKEVLTPHDPSGVNPSTRAEWERWVREIGVEIDAVDSLEDLNELRRVEQPRIEMAPDAYGQQVSNAFAEALADYQEQQS